MIERLSRVVCQVFGHSRDWPEMETCSRCGERMPLGFLANDKGRRCPWAVWYWKQRMRLLLALDNRTAGDRVRAAAHERRWRDDEFNDPT